jgi:hypothetical protein
MSDGGAPERKTIIVPGESHDDDLPEGLVRPQDIESTSRSCLAIIVILLLITLMICLFLLLQPFVN